MGSGFCANQQPRLALRTFSRNLIFRRVICAMSFPQRTRLSPIVAIFATLVECLFLADHRHSGCAPGPGRGRGHRSSGLIDINIARTLRTMLEIVHHATCGMRRHGGVLRRRRRLCRRPGMKSDQALKQDVEQELPWDPAIDARQIRVTVHDRIYCHRRKADSDQELRKHEQRGGVDDPQSV
jgi:hypothetical protein